MATHIARRNRRLPAPLALVVAPTRWAWKKRSAKRAAMKADRRSEERLERLLDRRLGAGEQPADQSREVATASVAVPAADALPVVDAAEVADRLQVARDWVYEHRRDVGAPLGVAAGVAALRWVVHLATGYNLWSLVAVGLPVLAVAGGGTWWALQVDPRDVSLRTKWAAWGTVVVGLLWVLSPASLPLWNSGGVGGRVASIPQLWISLALALAIGAIWGVGAGETGTRVRLTGLAFVLAAMAWISTAILPAAPDSLTLIPGLPYGIDWVLWTGWTGVATKVRWGRFKVRPVEVPEIGPVEIWAAELGGDKQELAGSRLVNFERRSSTTWEADVACVRGKHGTNEVRGKKDTIAGIFGINPDWIEVQGQDDYSRPHLIVTTRATLATSRPWTPGGFDLSTGLVEMGTYPDGSRSCFVAFVPGQGIRHFWIYGGTGSGKTGTVSVYLGRLMQHGLLVLDLCDLGETSLPAWVGKSFRFGTTPADGMMALRRANAVMDARAAAMRTMTQVQRDGSVVTGVSTLTPSQEWPIYAPVIEEWPEMLQHPEAVRLADRLGRKGRKYAVMLGVVSQGASLQEAFKGAEGLRKNIQQGNVGGLRSDSTAGAMGFGGGLKVNMGSIPMGKPGLGYIMSPANMRDIMSRTDWVDDDPDRPANVPSSWEVAAHAIPGTPNAVDLAAIEAVERELEQEAASVHQLRAVDDGPAGVTREAVAAEARRLSREAGEAVRLGDIAKAFMPAGMDDAERPKVTDRVRKHLDTLVGDPTSGVTKPEWGKYRAAS